MKKNPLLEELHYRQTFIITADNTFTECERLTSTPIDSSDQAKRHWRRAAKLYGIAAEYYRRSGLGLRAIAAWRGASKCYEALGMTKEQEAYRLKSVSIPVYYGEVSDG
jgi:hypothetical protein